MPKALNGIFVSSVVLILVLTGDLHSAPPVIKDFSSRGGHTRNKDGPRDSMYLVKGGDKITFSITATGVQAYEWQVNKKVQPAGTGNSFAWTVPDGKGIWEIHLKATGGGKETHQEWVVSTLSKNEAPDIFDYFTDGKYMGGRTEKDPWGRPLKEWKPHRGKVIDASGGFLSKGAMNQPMSIDMSYPHGTWRFWYRFPRGWSAGGGAVTVSAKGTVPRGNWYYQKTFDAHHHCGIGGRKKCIFSFDYDGTGFYEDGDWHRVTVIRTPDKWLYVFNDMFDAPLEFYAHDKLDAPPAKFGITLSGGTVWADNVEIYRDRFLFPKTEVYFGKYTWNYHKAKNTTYGSYEPETRSGVIVKGRNLKLSDIARLLGDPSKFSYDKAARKAVCKADLVIYDGAEFSMQNETLIFNCGTDGERHFVLRYGAEVRIKDSTITTANDHYFIWNNASSTTHYGRPIRYCWSGSARPLKKSEWLKTRGVGHSGRVWPLGNAGVIRFTAKNSTINNTAHIFWDSPMELDITDTRFTNLREVDIGGYKGVPAIYGYRERLFAKADKSFWVYTDEVNTNKFNLRNVSFSGKKGPLNITFLINALRDKLNVYDLNLPNDNVVIRKSMPQHLGQSHGWKRYYDAGYRDKTGGGSGMDSRLGLVNCKFKNLVVPTDKAWGIPKYYLDVKVVSRGGSPVRGAKITVTNEIDNANYPAENRDEKQPVFDPKPSSANQYAYLHYRLIQGLPNPSTVTGAGGHTPPPKDRKNTVILADYVQDKSGKKEFAYTITVEAGGKKKTITGVNPGPEWYRPDPNKPTYTITAVLDGATVSEVDLKKKGLAGHTR